MAFLLRGFRQGRWYGAIHNADSPLPADPLADLNTVDNSLSVWAIQDDLRNLPEIVTGLSATREYMSNMDVVLVREENLSEIGIDIGPSPARTPLAGVDAFHCDLIGLTAAAIVSLAETLRRHGLFYRFSEKKVRDLLVAAINAGRLEPTGLGVKILEDLTKRGLLP